VKGLKGFAASEGTCTVATYRWQTSKFTTWTTICPPLVITCGNSVFLDFHKKTLERTNVQEEAMPGYLNDHARDLESIENATTKTVIVFSIRGVEQTI
jgi:ribosomal protein S27AE